MSERLGDDDYRRLLELRDGLRRSLRWSEDSARAAGLTPGRAPPAAPERSGLVRRRPDADDHRVVRLELTARGSRQLAAVGSLHSEELRRLAAELAPLLKAL